MLRDTKVVAKLRKMSELTYGYNISFFSSESNRFLCLRAMLAYSVERLEMIPAGYVPHRRINEETFVHGRGRHKSREQHYYEELKGYILTNEKIFQFPRSACRIIGQHALCGKVGKSTRPRKGKMCIPPDLQKFWLTYFSACRNIIIKTGNLSVSQSVDIRCCARGQCLTSFERVWRLPHSG